jgi:HEAT repeat protein
VARHPDLADPWADQRELLAQEALTSASGADPQATLAVMTHALRDPATRGTALDMIGALGLAAGVPAIVAVLGPHLGEDDLVRAAAALGDIGGEAARAALATVAELMPGSAPVQEEVLAALAQLDRRGSA